MPTKEDEIIWESIPTGGVPGEQWDFDAQNPMIGIFQGVTSVTTKRPRNDGSDQARAYLFDVNGHPHFLWATAQLDAAFGVEKETGTSLIVIGDTVRVTYVGKVGLDDGRTMHSYKVDAAKRS